MLYVLKNWTLLQQLPAGLFMRRMEHPGLKIVWRVSLCILTWIARWFQVFRIVQGRHNQGNVVWPSAWIYLWVKLSSYHEQAKLYTRTHIHAHVGSFSRLLVNFHMSSFLKDSLEECIGFNIRHLSKLQYFLFIYLLKDPVADATDAPQP